jgi:hypothetical protein
MKLRLIRRKVVINTKSERSFVGILWSRSFGIWKMKNVMLLKDSGEQVPVDGEVVVLREDIDFVQVLP